MNQRVLQERIAHWTQAIPVRIGRDDPDDSAKFIELFNSIYARQITPAYYYWRFCNQASKGTVFLAYDQDRLKGCCGYHLCRMGGSPAFSTALVVDMMVDAGHRGTGLVFARLNFEVENSARRSGASALFLFPNQRGAAAWLADENWVELGQMVTCVCDTRQEPLISSIDIRSVSRFDRWVDELADAFERIHPQLTSVRRESQYLNWRFVANPVYHYDLYRVQRNDNLFGYLVLKMFRDPKTGQAFGDIVDLLWTEDDPDVLAEMLHFALGHFHAQEVPQATMWLQTNTILDQIGRGLGFIETEQRRYFCCKVLEKQYEWLKDPSRWFITMADSEIY